MEVFIILVFLVLFVLCIKQIILGIKIRIAFNKHQEASEELNELLMKQHFQMEYYKIPEELEDFDEVIDFKIKRKKKQQIWTFIKYLELQKNLSRYEKSWIIYFLKETENETTRDKLLNLLFFK